VYIPLVVNKPSYIHSNHDIVGSQPRANHIGLNRKETNLSNADIAGSIPDCQKFKTTRKPCNPLNPEYVLQKVEMIQAPIPRFIRDAIDNSDITGHSQRKREKWKCVIATMSKIL
jgi:hypothetical protein